MVGKLDPVPSSGSSIRESRMRTGKDKFEVHRRSPEQIFRSSYKRDEF